MRFAGDFAGHSDGQACQEAAGGPRRHSTFGCFFEAERACESGAPATPAGSGLEDQLRDLAPDQGLAFYQAVQAHLFRLNEVTTADILKRRWLVRLDDDGGELVGVDWGWHPGDADAHRAEDFAGAIRAWAANLTGEQACRVYVASPTSRPVAALRGLLERPGKAAEKARGPCRFRVLGLQDYWGHHPNLKKQVPNREAVDLLFDVHVLSGASLIVGSLASEVGRIASDLRQVD